MLSKDVLSPDNSFHFKAIDNGLELFELICQFLDLMEEIIRLVKSKKNVQSFFIEASAPLKGAPQQFYQCLLFACRKQLFTVIGKSLD